MNLFQKLLWRSENRWQLIGAGLGTAMGLVLILGAFQLYLDVNRLLNKDEGADPRYVQINKRVSLLNTIGGASTFSEEDIEEILKEPFVQSLGVLTANNFRVSASSENLGFYTELFFEAVPDGFLDVRESRFQWQEGDRELPILLSRDYLALYNFGFAPSQGLPQLTPGSIQRVGFEITIANGQRQAKFQGRIVGFSDRYNSILVPQPFMDWANAHFGDAHSTKEPSRLILEVDNPLASDFLDFVAENNYELSTGRLVGGQIQTMVGFLTLLLLFIGGLIFLLSLLIFLLNFRLLVVQSRDDIGLLLQIGYRQRQIYTFLNRRLQYWFANIGIGTALTLIVAHWLLGLSARAQGLEIPLMIHPLVWILGALLSAGFVYLNYWSIRQNVVQTDLQ